MAFPLGALTSSFLFLVAFSLPNVHATIDSSWGHAAHNMVGRRSMMKSDIHKHHPVFRSGPWKQAHATYYDGGAGTFGSACGYEDVVKDGYGLDTAALSTSLFKNGKTCGACYEIKCVNSESCTRTSIIVTGTNVCNGGRCSPPHEHFDLAKQAFNKIAEYKAGVVSVHYRRIPCKKKGGIRFTITGNPYYNIIKVWNVGGAGDVIGVQVKGDKKLMNWTSLKRSWGQKWVTHALLAGETLTFRVRTSDDSYSTSFRVAPKTWTFGQTFEGKNFK